MLTVTSTSSRPLPHRRRALHCHPLPHPNPSSRRRSLSHPAPVSSAYDTSPASSLLPLDVDVASEDDDSLPPTLHSAPFALKETSDESSDLLSESASDDDDDSSSSLSSVSPAAPKAKQLQGTVGKRVLVQSHATHAPLAFHLPSLSGGEKATSVLHRKLKASSRQHKVSSHYYSPLKPLSRPTHSNDLLLTPKLHRRAQLQALVPSVDSPVLSPVPVVTPLFIESPIADTSSSPSSPIPTSSLSRYALLLLLLHRTDGRDKLVKAVYYASNELRWALRSLTSRLSRHPYIASLLTGGSPLSSFPLSLLARLGLAGLVVGRRLDAMLGAMGVAMGSARQLLRFGRWVADLDALHCAWKAWRAARAAGVPSLLPLLELVTAALGLLIDLLDDVEWLAEQQVLPGAVSPYAGAVSAGLWLVSVGMEMPLQVREVWGAWRQGGDEWRGEALGLVKLVGDGVYATSLLGSAVGGWTVNEGLAQGGGLASAIISLINFHHRHAKHRSVAL